MVRTRGVVAVVAVTALALSGCAEMRRDKYCKWGIPAWGAVAGGTGAGLGVGLGDDDASDGEIAGAAVGGTLVGGLLGWLVAHNVCEEPEAPPPPPPAPPPPPPPPPAKGTKLGTVGEAYFDFDKAHLKPGAADVLSDAVRTLKDNPSVHAEVAGHTDSIGSEAYNMKLSERRAEAVKRYLVDQGIDASRLDARGYGESRPIADNKTKQGRAQNRRAEIIVE